MSDSTARQISSETNSTPKSPAAYVCGHAEEELRRLEAQGMFLRASTRDFLQRVGITSGMRVLDVGCGAGDVSFAVAELVGPSGEIVGFDRADTATSVAAARAHAKGLANVHFVLSDIDHIAEAVGSKPFDAVVGRAVMMHQRNPAEAVRKLLRLVRPGGVIGFQEADLSARYWSTHKLPTLEAFWEYCDKFVAIGMMCPTLPSAFRAAFEEAGITSYRIIRTGAIESAADDNGCRWIGDLARMFPSVAPKMGIPPPNYDPNTFVETLKHEVENADAAYTPCFWLGAAARLPFARAIEA